MQTRVWHSRFLPQIAVNWGHSSKAVRFPMSGRLYFIELNYEFNV